MADFDELWDYGDPEATEAAFRALLPAARETGDRDYLAQLLAQIARAQGLQLRFEDAARTLDEAETLIAPELRVARVRLLLERGRLLNSSQRREESKPLFLAAWDEAREAGADGLAVDAAHMLGIVEPGKASVEWNRAAIAYAERSSDPAARRWLGSLANNLGWTYHGAGDYVAALGLFEQALAAREREGDEEKTRIARWCVARALRSLGRTGEALAAQQELLAGPPDGFVHEELAECLAELGREPEAKEHFAAAYRLLSRDQWLRRDEPERLERLRRLAGVDSPAKKEAKLDS